MLYIYQFVTFSVFKDSLSNIEAIYEMSSEHERLHFNDMYSNHALC